MKHTLVMRIFLPLVIAGCLSGIAIQAAEPATTIGHDPLPYFVPGHRIGIAAEVTDPAGVKLVRCYFRGQQYVDFCFVEMPGSGGDAYRGILPAPDYSTEKIVYLLLAVNNDDLVVKSQMFAINRSDSQEVPEWQATSCTCVS